MTVGNVINLVELGIAGRGLGNRPNPEILRDIIKSKWLEFIGEARSHDSKFTLTTDGAREYELPESVRIVSRVYIDNQIAIKTTPEARDNTYADYQASL